MMNMRKKFLQNTGPMLPGMEISDTSHLSPELTFLPVVFPARTFPVQGDEQVSPESEADSGQSSIVSFVSYDRATSLWRTWQLSLAGELIPYLGTWPRAGMMRNGRCYQQRRLVRRTLEKEFSLWRTPQVADSKSARVQSGFTTNLTHQVMYPTPLGTDANGGSTNRSRGSKNVRPSLARLAYTDRQGLAVGVGQCSDATLQRNSRPLSEIAAQGQASGQLNPTWVEWLMGFPLEWSDLEDLETP